MNGQASNQFHGGLTYYYSGTNLNANNYFYNQVGVPRSHEVANQWGANLGGPILKDKLFFFTDFEGDRYITPNAGVAAFPSAQRSSCGTRFLASPGRL